MFKDNIVLITGAASGIGFETAKQFLDNEAKVVGVDFDETTLNEAVKSLGDNFIAKLCDVSKEEEIRKVRDDVESSHGKLDILVNNAGVARFMPPDQITEEDFYFHYDIIVKGPMLFVKHFLPLLKKSSSPCIVNIGSLSSRGQLPNQYLYSTAKAALEQCTRHLTCNYPGIRANNILPGLVETPIWGKSHTEEEIEAIVEVLATKVPCGRVGKPEDIANCVLFLSSENASYINGASIVIDGGFNTAVAMG